MSRQDAHLTVPLYPHRPHSAASRASNCVGAACAGQTHPRQFVPCPLSLLCRTGSPVGVREGENTKLISIHNNPARSSSLPDPPNPPATHSSKVYTTSAHTVLFVCPCRSLHRFYTIGTCSLEGKRAEVRNRITQNLSFLLLNSPISQ